MLGDIKPNDFKVADALDVEFKATILCTVNDSYQVTLLVAPALIVFTRMHYKKSFTEYNLQLVHNSKEYSLLLVEDDVLQCTLSKGQVKTLPKWCLYDD